MHLPPPLPFNSLFSTTTCFQPSSNQIQALCLAVQPQPIRAHSAAECVYLVGSKGGGGGDGWGADIKR